MDDVEEFIRLAERQGVQLNGIEPARIPGRGIGVTATRALKVHIESRHSSYGVLFASPPVPFPYLAF